MSFATASVSRVGGRQRNEDACAWVTLGQAGCWVVADGLGGHQGGEVASHTVMDAILASFRQNPESTPRALAMHLEAAQAAILDRERRETALSGMRSTAVVLVSDGRSALWAHIGDSRLFYFQNGRIIFQTKDHSLVEAMARAGEIASQEVRHHEDRNRLLRALGDDTGIRPTIAGKKQRLCRGDAVFLCSDGFWANITEAEMEADLAKAESPQEWLAQMEIRVLERVSGEYDNYTGIGIFFPSARAPMPPSPLAKPSRLGASRIATLILLVPIFVVACWLFYQRSYLLDSSAQSPISPQAVPPKHVYVPAARKEYGTIQDAIAAISPGEEIWLGPGSYEEKLAPINKPVCLRGADAAGSRPSTLIVSEQNPLTFESPFGQLEFISIRGAQHGPGLVLKASFSGAIKDVSISGGKCLVSIRDQALPRFLGVAFEGADDTTECFCGARVPTAPQIEDAQLRNTFKNCKLKDLTNAER